MIGGRLVVPVGSNAWDQTLWVVERTDEGETSTNLGPVRFVPLTGEGQHAVGLNGWRCCWIRPPARRRSGRAPGAGPSNSSAMTVSIGSGA